MKLQFVLNYLTAKKNYKFDETFHFFMDESKRKLYFVQPNISSSTIYFIY